MIYYHNLHLSFQGSCVSRGEQYRIKKKLKSLYILSKKCPHGHKTEKFNKNAKVDKLTKKLGRGVSLSLKVLCIEYNKYKKILIFLSGKADYSVIQQSRSYKFLLISKRQNSKSAPKLAVHEMDTFRPNRCRLNGVMIKGFWRPGALKPHQMQSKHFQITA